MSSSTSSFNGIAGEPGKVQTGNGKERTGRRYPGWGLLGFIVLIVFLEIAVFRNIDFYGLSPGFIGQIAELKHSFARADADQIEIAVLGDSQSIDALRPEMLAAELGIPRERIFNFSISGGSAFDIAKTYDRYKDRLPRLKKAIVVVNEHQLNDTLNDGDVKFKYFAGLRDRLAVMNADNYGELLLGWALKMYDMRTVWADMVLKYRSGKLRDHIPAHEGGLAPVVWSKPEDRTKAYANEVADRWFQQYRIDGVRTRAFDAMIRELRSRGVAVTILQLPRSSYFEDTVKEKYGKQQDAYFAVVRGIAERYGASFEVMPNDELTLDDFRDTNHVNPKGAEWVSRYVARRWLR